MDERREREWLKWCKAEQGDIEDKEEEKEDGVCKVVIYNYFVLALIPCQIWL